jgi:hypothetical protein
MASEIIVQTIKGPTSGANANKVIIPSGQTLHAAGHVLQVQSYTLQGSVTFTNHSSTVNSGLQIAITPKFANSKIHVTMDLGSFCSLTTGSWCAGRLYRNGSPISGALATTGTNTNYGNLDGYSYMHASVAGRYKPNETDAGIEQLNHSVKPVSFNYLDTPNSTSTQTYALYVYVRKNTSTTGAINRTPDNAISSDHAIQGLSTITVMEIAQ